MSFTHSGWPGVGVLGTLILHRDEAGVEVLWCVLCELMLYS